MPLGKQAELNALSLLPKAELHLHLEGCLSPRLLVQLAAAHGETLSNAQAAARYETHTFPEFLDLFKWATFYLRAPSNYAALARAALADLAAQHVRYAEITLSVGVMLLRGQDVTANFAAIREAVAAQSHRPPVHVQWIFDTVRQFGPEKAMEVARLAAQLKSEGVAAFGLGGDEESLPASDFRKIYEFAASEGLHRVAHAGEMGGPQAVRDAAEILGAERIGHGISSVQDEKLMDLLIERQIPLEICPVSNLRTGALAKLLGVKQARLEDHPLPKFVARSVPVTLATDDPSMFHTSLMQTYEAARRQLGLSLAQILHLAEAGFQFSFLPPGEKESLLNDFRSEARRLGLL